MLKKLKIEMTLIPPIKMVSQINIKLNRVKKHFVFNLINPTIKMKRFTSLALINNIGWIMLI